MVDELLKSVNKMVKYINSGEEEVGITVINEYFPHCKSTSLCLSVEFVLDRQEGQKNVLVKVDQFEKKLVKGGRRSAPEAAD